MMGAGLVPVPGEASPVIGLACLPQTGQTGPICEQLREVIAEAQPGQTVTLLAADALPAEGSVVRLHVEGLKTFGISAHLEWRTSGGDWQRDETLSMSVMDKELNAAMTRRFLQDLWKRCPIGQ